jgi:acyl-CoA thioesterase YciA
VNRQDRDCLPTDASPALRIVAMPTDTNAAGDIFGGWMMSQVDIAGSIEAHRTAEGRVVTVAVNEFRFLKPVYVGDLISIYTELNRIGNTSLQVHVQAFAERGRYTEECYRVAEALLTYVAVDESGRPRPVKA